MLEPAHGSEPVLRRSIFLNTELVAEAEKKGCSSRSSQTGAQVMEGAIARLTEINSGVHAAKSVIYILPKWLVRV